MDLSLYECFRLSLLAFRAAGVRGHHELARIIAEFLCCEKEERYRDSLLKHRKMISSISLGGLSYGFALDKVLKSLPLSVLIKAMKSLNNIYIFMQWDNHLVNAELHLDVWYIDELNGVQPVYYKDHATITVFDGEVQIVKYDCRLDT